MKYTIKSKSGETIFFEDGEIDAFLVTRSNKTIAVLNEKEFLNESLPTNIVIEYFGASERYYILFAKKEDKVINIEIGDSSLKHR